MFKMFLFSFLTLFFLVSCSSESIKPQQSDSLNYDLVISQKRRELPKEDFINWLRGERKRLLARAEGFEGALYSTSARGSYQEVSSAPTSGASGPENFNIQMTNLELKRLQQKLDQVRREIRTIDAVLSSVQ